MNISLYNLNKDQTNILKALAITLIVFHNFLHMLSTIGENEMALDPRRVFNLIEICTNPNYLSISFIFREFASYIGWAGVPIFVFISGFGLTKAFLNKEPKSYFKYIIPRLKKLYLLFLFAYIIYFFLVGFTYGFDFNKYDYIRFIILSLIAMPIKNYNLDVAYRYIGPGWYFCLATQLYILFPLLLKFAKKYNLRGSMILLIICYLFIYITEPIATKYGFPIYANFIGHLPEFTLGIIFAMYKQLRINWKIVLIAVVLFILANFYQIFYPFTFSSFTLLFLFVIYPLYTKLSTSNIIYKFLVFIGKISMFIFVLNAPIRNLYTLKLADGLSVNWQVAISFIHYIIVIIAAYATSIIYRKIGNGFDITKEHFLSKIQKRSN